MADENASTLGQHPRIDGKGKIAKVAIFGKNSRCWTAEVAGALEQLLWQRVLSANTGCVKAQVCYWTKQTNHHVIDSR
jgi:hypothetical protein